LDNHKPSKGKVPEILIYTLTTNGPQKETKASGSMNQKRTASTGALFSGVGDAIGHG